MNFKPLKNYFALWISQFASSLGSSMTSFAITIWAFAETESAMVLSISGISILLPKMISGIIAGPFIEKLNKKVVLIFSDIGSGLCSLLLFLLIRNEAFQMWHLYCLNAFTSVFACFQSLANDVVFSMIVPKEQYTSASGMQSFSTGTVQILSPALSAIVLNAAGITGVILFDLLTMFFSCIALIFFVSITEKKTLFKLNLDMHSYLHDLSDGLKMLQSKKLLTKLLFFFVFINFVAGMTYFNLLTPMILERTKNNTIILAWVNGALGLGGIIGGIITTIAPSPKSKVKAVFLCAAQSFLLGDILIAIGKTPLIWIFAAFMSSVFLPFLNAYESYLWRICIPIDFQGRVYSLKSAFQFGAIQVGILIGGALADLVFEPFMFGSSYFISAVVGSTSGSGMALMFLFTGCIGLLISVMGIRNQNLNRMESALHLKNLL